MCTYKPVADPGFPIGGACTHWGGVDLQRGHFLVKMYAKTKELGPIGGRAPATPPRSANANDADLNPNCTDFMWRLCGLKSSDVCPTGQEER